MDSEELDTDAIWERHRAIYQSNTYPQLLAATSRALPDVPNLLELVKTVKFGWTKENERANNLQQQVDMMLPVIEAAHEMIRFRNEHWGDPSKPEWWTGGDFKLVAAMKDLMGDISGR